MALNAPLDPFALSYSVVIRPDVYDDGTTAYIAEIPDLPGCKSHGATVEQARANLADAQREYLEALQAEGIPIPPPAPLQPSVVWTVSFQSERQDRPPIMPSLAFARG